MTVSFAGASCHEYDGAACCAVTSQIAAPDRLVDDCGFPRCPVGKARTRAESRTTMDDHASATYLEHRSLLFSIAYRMTGSVEEAEDIASEVFLR
jgi:hypothetical protein